jgi:hypothetical protein
VRQDTIDTSDGQEHRRAPEHSEPEAEEPLWPERVFCHIRHRRHYDSADGETCSIDRAGEHFRRQCLIGRTRPHEEKHRAVRKRGSIDEGHRQRFLPATIPRKHVGCDAHDRDPAALGVRV